MQARCGRITASKIADVMNFLKPTKAELESGERREGAERRNYRADLVSERLTLQPTEHYVSPYMDWGSEHENDARRAYELRAGVMVDQTGFVLHPSFDYAGSSPDGLVDDGGGVEIKCPQRSTHLGYLEAGIVPEEYQPQMYFNMICCERQWWDFVSYHPHFPREIQLFVCRLNYNRAECDSINDHVLRFNSEVQAQIGRLMTRYGPFTLPAQIVKRQPMEGGLTDEDFEFAKTMHLR
jgi:hypothetical protein